MKSLIPYLVFPGTCRQALEFYVQAFDGKILSMQTFAQASMKVAPEHQMRIFDCTFQAENVVLKASDDLPDHFTHAGSNVSMFVAFSDDDERERVFHFLAQGGDVVFPLDETFGMLRDPFGVQWMFVKENR